MQDVAYRADTEPPKHPTETPKGRGRNPNSLANLRRTAKGEPSTNPSGRSKKDYEVAAEAQKYAPDCIRVLGQIVNDNDAPHATRISAAAQILDRAYGKAPQSLNVKAELSFSEQFEQFIRECNARTIDHDGLADQSGRVETVELQLCDAMPESKA